MTKYCDRETYRRLYARYLIENGRSPTEFLDLAGDLKDKTVLDLCGGAGELAVGAKKRGAKLAHIVDGDLEMVDLKVVAESGVSMQQCSVEEWLCSDCYPSIEFDVVFCRQAVNYWIDYLQINRLSNRIKKGGIFIFNTFNQRPNYSPKVKQYNFNGLDYVETSWFLDGMVQHVQICGGMKPHFNEFRWVSSDEFEMLFSGFTLEKHTFGATDMYVCTKK